jgi:choline kinase
VIFGLILAAGNQNRFLSDKPKALADYKGECLLDHNIEELSKVCEKVYVVCSTTNEHYFDNKYNKIIVESGYGSGDAILSALDQIRPTFRDKCIIQWGDSISHNDIISKSFDAKELGVYGIVVPCVYEEHPYVQFIQQSNLSIKVLFSKFDEPVSAGYHDISIFYCNAFQIYHNLNTYKMWILNPEPGDKKYIYPEHGDEMEFLDILNHTDITAKLKIVEDYKDLSFNTIEELEQINKE